MTYGKTATVSLIGRASATKTASGTATVATDRPGVADPRERAATATADATMMAAIPWSATSCACPKSDARAVATPPSHTATSASTPSPRAHVRQARPRGVESATAAAGSS